MQPKLIIALDFSLQKQVFALIEKLDPNVCALKVGSQLFTLFGPDLVRQLCKKGFKVFLDLKFHDIPNTVAHACRAAADLGVWMVNIHASGGIPMMQKAVQALETYGETRPLLIAVTVLTSILADDLATIGIHGSVETQVTHLAQLALQAGLDGVVSSAFEVPMIKQTCGANFLTVTPGIRLAGDASDDQKRFMTAIEAKAKGADFLVLGRSITASGNPSERIRGLLLKLSSRQQNP